MDKVKYRMLVVDDEPRYVRAMQVSLEMHGYEVLIARDGASALSLAAGEHPDLILLDIKIPEPDGYVVCQRVREFSAVPIIMLTALAHTADKVKGLELGADDYITKPFSVDELIARVRAALRRLETWQPIDPQPVRSVGRLQVDLAGQRVFVAEHEVSLTATEYRLLCELIKRPGQCLPPAYLLDKVWGVGYDGHESLVWKTIHRLRNKIESDPSLPRYIETKPGLGYILREDP